METSLLVIPQLSFELSVSFWKSIHHVELLDALYINNESKCTVVSIILEFLSQLSSFSV